MEIRSFCVSKASSLRAHFGKSVSVKTQQQSATILEKSVETVNPNRDYKGSDNQTNISPRTILCQSLVKSYRQRWSKKSCPRLRELASLRPEALERGITQPRAHFFGPIYKVGIFVKSLSRIMTGKADDFVQQL